MNARHHIPGLDHNWIPFKPNRYFHAHPKLLASAKGAYCGTGGGSGSRSDSVQTGTARHERI